MAAQHTIIIAGAGIGGLTAALTLAREGVRVIVLEQAARLEEIGAGLQLSPNASRILVGLGLSGRLSTRAVTPEAIRIMSVRAGGELMRLSLGAAAVARAGAPYWVVHRADLQGALAAAVADHPGIELRMNTTFAEVTTQAAGLNVVTRSGETSRSEPASALIGADGIWSTVRQHIFPHVQPHFSGLIAWRGTIDASHLPGDDAAPCVQLWMGSNAHLVAYPVSAGRQLNVVAIMRGDRVRKGWSVQGNPADLMECFAMPRWPEPARRMLAAVETWRKWALFTLPDDMKWSQGTIALLGDAAHAMLPFAAQGAGMAIEDAAVLAGHLTRDALGSPAGIAAALQRYEVARKARVRRMMRTARQQGRIYHLGGLSALARDAAIRIMGPERMLARQDWIYGWVDGGRS